MDQPHVAQLQCCHGTPRVDMCHICHGPTQNMKAQNPGLTEWVSFEGSKNVWWNEVEWMLTVFKRNDYDFRVKYRCLIKEPCKTRCEAENLWQHSRVLAPKQLKSQTHSDSTQKLSKDTLNTTTTPLNTTSQRPTKNSPQIPRKLSKI